MIRFCFVVLCCLACSVAAQADSFVIAPPWYQPSGTDAEDLSDKIAELVEAELKSHYKVFTPWDAVDGLPREHRVACFGGECAKRSQEKTHATAAIVVRVYREAEGEGPSTSFQIGLQPELGLLYAHSAFLSEGTLEELTARVLGDVFRDYRRGAGPFLYVNGGPEGATIYVDERPVEKLPARFSLSVGPHRVRVEAPGYQSVTQITTLSLGKAQELEFHLEPARSAEISPPTPFVAPAVSHAADDTKDDPKYGRRRWASIGLIVSGAALIGIGAGYLGVGARRNDQEGDCTESMSDCRSFYGLDGSSGALLGVGAAFTALGTISLGTGVGLLMRNKRLQFGGSMGAQHAALIMKGEL